MIQLNLRFTSLFHCNLWHLLLLQTYIHFELSVCIHVLYLYCIYGLQSHTQSYNLELQLGIQIDRFRQFP